MSRLGVRNGFTRPKSFKDIKWKQHRVGKGSIQGLLMLNNGIEFSVVAGPTMYSLPKDAGTIQINLDQVHLVVMVFLDGTLLSQIEMILIIVKRKLLKMYLNRKGLRQLALVIMKQSGIMIDLINQVLILY